jgi:hypothetical protein
MKEEDFKGEILAIDLPPGLGTHSWKLDAAKNSKEP